MKKIVYVISSIKSSGPNRVLENMISGIDKTKYDVYVISFLNNDKQEEIEKLTENGAKYINLGLKRKVDILLTGLKKIKKVISEINPDIIHSHGLLPDIVCSRLKNVKKITTIHCDIFADYSYTFGNFKGIIWALIHRAAFKKFDKVVCCSKTVYDALKNKNNDNLMFIRNGIKKIDIDSKTIRSKIRDEIGIKEDEIVYLYVGSLSKRKNVKYLAEQFDKYSVAGEYLLILGQGEYYDEICNLNNSRIKALGYKTNPLEYMCASDVYISASKSEGLSISAIEAMEKNLCLFLSNIDSHKEFFSINNESYQGELFKEDEFEEKISLIRNNFKNKEVHNDEIKEKYLSDIAMMHEYMKEYENGEA